MPNFEDIIKYINIVLQLVFGKNIPAWISTAVGWILLIGLLLCGVWGLLIVISKITDLVRQSFVPLFYNREKKRLVRKRQTFAKHIEYEILRLDLLEDWKDERFAELEAEVEAEGEQRIFSFIPFLKRTRDGLRREKSLSAALTSSQARFILIEGSPGAGKSVALRHVTQKMATHAKKAKSLQSVIPIYVNLKELERAANEAVDRNLIEAFVKKTLTRINDRDVEHFLDEQFSIGIENGTWFFLFDSFDEIPEILSSSEADSIIRSYGNAIADFLQGGMNTCRGVIASRQFRGPKQFGWPHFHIMELTGDRIIDLIRKADFEHKVQEDFIGQLGLAPQEIRFMASNPLFLSLLCEHVKGKHPFPKNAHTVFETYVDSRLKRDEARLQKRFQLTISQIRACAENVAFCMAADTGIGLSPTRESLRNSLQHLQIEQDNTFDILLDALEYTKLARPGTGTDVGQPRSFTFAHRRFQEYFSTSVVLRDLTRVSPTQLLVNARWRETAVVIGQTQPIGILSPILQHAEEWLTQYCNGIPQLINDPIKYIKDKKHSTTDDEEEIPYKFPWPAGSLHLLALLQDGFASHLDDLPNTIRVLVSKLVLTATEIGGPDDRKWALEVAGVAPDAVLSYLLSKAFSSSSQWLKEVAYQQTSRLSKIPPDISEGIRQAIVELMLSGRLNKEKQATRAHLSRLPHAEKFLSTMNLLLQLPFIDTIWGTLLFICIEITSTLSGEHTSWGMVTTTIFAYVIMLIIIWTPSTFKVYFYLSNKNTLTMITRVRLLLFLLVTFLLLLLAHNSHNNPSNNSLNLFSLLLFFCFLFTGSIAFYAASTKYYSYWIQWAFIPFYPIFWLILYIYGEFRTQIKYPYKNRSDIFTYISEILIIILSVLLMITLPIGLLFAAGVFLIILLKNHLHDRKQWNIWLTKYQKAMTYREFWKTVNSYKTTRYRIRMIKAIREQQLLIATDKAENFLRKIAQETEKTGQSHLILGTDSESYVILSQFLKLCRIDALYKYLKNLDAIALTEKMLQRKNSETSLKNIQLATNHTKSKTKRHKTLSWLDSTALDEISQLLEAIRRINENIL